jgi:hypothetical protein
LFDENHLNFEYREQWMREIIEKIRGAEAQVVDDPTAPA